MNIAHHMTHLMAAYTDRDEQLRDDVGGTPTVASHETLHFLQLS